MAGEMIFQFYTKVIKGVGTIKQVGEEAKGLKGKRAFIVTGPNILRTGMIDEVRSSLNESGISSEVFSEVEPNPSVKTVEKGRGILASDGFDLIVAVGGGSNIDAAKAMAVMAVNPGSICDYEGADKFQNPPLPIIAIPTTAGTGSEVTFASVVTDTERDYKFVVWSRLLAPKVAILDPLTLSTAPQTVIIAAGMDALTHAIESYVSKLANPYTENFALTAIELISKNLPSAVADPTNLVAVENMLMASNMAGISFTNTRLGIVHAMALPPSALFDVPHGIANTILLPHGIEFNRIGNPTKYAHIAYAMGESAQTVREASLLAADAVRKLATDIGAPFSLSEVGVKSDTIPKMAEDAMKSGHLAVNPRKVTFQDMVEIYQAAF
jgi:alcohol dehydrogenase class IV